METNARTIGGRLKDLRDQKGMSQQEVANLLGILQETYSKWETDKVQITKRGALAQLALLYGVTEDYITRKSDGIGHYPEEIQQFLRDNGEEATRLIVSAYGEYKKIMLQKAMKELRTN